MGLVAIMASRLYHMAMASLELTATLHDVKTWANVPDAAMEHEALQKWKSSPKDVSKLTEMMFQMLKERERRQQDYLGQNNSAANLFKTAAAEEDDDEQASSESVHSSKSSSSSKKKGKKAKENRKKQSKKETSSIKLNARNRTSTSVLLSPSMQRSPRPAKTRRTRNERRRLLPAMHPRRNRVTKRKK
eukprot:6489656-Amphidinium_carterae.1